MAKIQKSEKYPKDRDAAERKTGSEYYLWLLPLGTAAIGSGMAPGGGAVGAAGLAVTLGQGG